MFRNEITEYKEGNIFECIQAEVDGQQTSKLTLELSLPLNVSNAEDKIAIGILVARHKLGMEIISRLEVLAMMIPNLITRTIRTITASQIANPVTPSVRSRSSVPIVSSDEV